MEINIFFMIDGKRMDEKKAASPLTEESINNIKQLGHSVSEYLARYSNAMIVSPSFTSRYTGFYLKNTVTNNGRTIDYNAEILLKDVNGVSAFIEKKLKTALCKNNVVVAEKAVCEEIIKNCVKDAIFDENSVCYITYIPEQDKFIYGGNIK